MNKIIIKQLVKDTKIKQEYIIAVLNLLNEGSTVPFIARYRKELTGNLDEDQIRLVEKEFLYQSNLEKRKEEITRLIQERATLTDELKVSIDSATKLQTLEDIYLPYKEKKKTKATEAIKNGLKPLAEFILTNPKSYDQISDEAIKYINEVVDTIEKCIEGAKFIIAEMISENSNYREFVRLSMNRDSVLTSKLKRGAAERDEKKTYEMYYEFSQAVTKLPGYRILALNRAEKEKILNVSVVYNSEIAIEYILKKEIKVSSTFFEAFLSEIIIDSLNRLIVPSIEREIRSNLTEKADSGAIKLFAENLDVLIMQPPLKNKSILCLDPAYRTGCKLAIIDQTGNLLATDVIYPHPPVNKVEESNKKLDKLLNNFKIDQIVIGNGTASRESWSFVDKYLKERNLTINFNLVSEAGASVYSASKIAQLEFPDLKVEMRSAVSIGRRVQDPMAELVKIEPKSIGVGQYQHDVNQKNLTENLDFVMLKNINKVGVDVNTASAELLKYVSGLDRTIAKNIVNYRIENGKFTSRRELLKVARLGAKSYQQAAGFLKIFDGKDKLDATFIHPESYKEANLILKQLGFSTDDIASTQLIEVVSKLDMIKFADDLEITETLCRDIIQNLCTPELDVREELKVASFDQSVTKIEDLSVGMMVQGQVRNIVEFGAFVDIGIKSDGLVHISQLSNKFVSNVADFVKIGDVNTFKVIAIDLDKGKVQLSLKEK